MTEGASQLDLVAMIGVVASVLIVGGLATWIPARRAASNDPIAALRAD